MAVAADGSMTARLARLTRRSEAARGLALVSPTMILMLAVLAAPLVFVVLYSFWSQDGDVLDTHFTLAQYAASVEKAQYRALLYRSIGISSLVTLATVVLAYPMAYFVAFHVRQAKFLWLVLLTIPFWTSYLLRIFAWLIILYDNGLINETLLGLGLIHEPLSLIYNKTAVILTLTHAWAPFAILPIYVSLEKIDRSLLDAAADLGDGPVRRFLRVTLPLSMTGVIGAAVLIFVPTTGDYATPQLVGGIPGAMIGRTIWDQFGGGASNWPLGAALSVVSMLAVAAVTVFFVIAMRAAARSLK